MHRNITGNVVRGDAIINPEDPMTKTQLFKHISEWGQYPYGAPMHSVNLEPNSFQIYPQGPVGGKRSKHAFDLRCHTNPKFTGAGVKCQICKSTSPVTNFFESRVTRESVPTSGRKTTFRWSKVVSEVSFPRPLGGTLYWKVVSVFRFGDSRVFPHPIPLQFCIEIQV